MSNAIKTTKRLESLLNRNEAEILQGLMVAWSRVQGHDLRFILQPKDGNWLMPHDEMHWEVYVKSPTKKLAEAAYEEAGVRIHRMLEAVRVGKALPQAPIKGTFAALVARAVAA